MSIQAIWDPSASMGFRGPTISGILELPGADIRSSEMQCRSALQMT